MAPTGFWCRSSDPPTTRSDLVGEGKLGEQNFFVGIIHDLTAIRQEQAERDGANRLLVQIVRSSDDAIRSGGRRQAGRADLFRRHHPRPDGDQTGASRARWRQQASGADRPILRRRDPIWWAKASWASRPFSSASSTT